MAAADKGDGEWYSVSCTILLIGSLLLSGCTSKPDEQRQTQPTETTKNTEAPGATQDTQADKGF